MTSVTTQLKQLADRLPKYAIQIGVFSGKANRKQKKQTALLGLNNAELMFIHENGSPLHNIPSRPVLKMTLDYGKTLVNEVTKKALNAYFQGGENAYVIELEKFCIRLENYARKIIYSNDGRLAPNAPSTIARKGDNHPLFDTGQLARSITCKLVKL